MRPLMLKGHERSLTKCLYNRTGDLLFSAAKDSKPCVWYADSGERIGTYKGHTGAVWALDVSWDSTLLLTGSADMSARLWDVETGQELFVFRHQTPVRDVAFGVGDRLLSTASDSVMGKPGALLLYQLAADPAAQRDVAAREIVLDCKATNVLFGPLNATLVSAHEDGSVRVWDTETGQLIKTQAVHSKTIQDMQTDKEGAWLITASSDCTAKLLDFRTLELVKTYESSKPVNSATISPIYPHVIIGGGQEAMEVTTSHTRTGNFQARFFHMIYAEEFATVKGHFGPINTLAFSPDGKSYASGGEDGYIRVHHFDESYHELVRSEEAETKAALAIAEKAAAAAARG